MSKSKRTAKRHRTAVSGSAVDEAPPERTRTSESQGSFFENGPEELRARFRSVLFHHLGLPLLRALHRVDPNAEYLGQEGRFCSGRTDRYADVFSEAVIARLDEDTGKEKDLTRILSASINAAVIGFTSDAEAHIPAWEVFPRASMDIVVVEESKKHLDM
jgi:hypothetical protein